MFHLLLVEIVIVTQIHIEIQDMNANVRNVACCFGNVFQLCKVACQDILVPMYGHTQATVNAWDAMEFA